MSPRVVGRYVLHDEIAAGGMATVHIGRLHGSVGFARTVAIKKLHAQFSKDPEFVAMFLDEAHLAARIRHPNVVPTLDVVSEGTELLLIMEYVQGESVARLLRSDGGRRPIQPGIAATIATEMLLGLHAAHEATDDQGRPLSIVHRDVSPQNVLVGVDGVARVVDFGVAKAVGRLQSTKEGQVKGKASYMAPEQLFGEAVDRRADVYAAGVVLWEMLTGKRLFVGDSPQATMMQVVQKVVEPPSAHVPNIPAALDAIVLRALSRDPSLRFATAREMALRVDDVMGRESSTLIGDWVQASAARGLEERTACIARIESERHVSMPEMPSAADEQSTGIVSLASSVVTSSPSRVGAAPSARRSRLLYAVGAGAVALLTVGGLSYGLGSRREPAASRATATAADVPASRPDPAPTPPPAACADPATTPAADLSVPAPPTAATSRAVAALPSAPPSSARRALSRAPRSDSPRTASQDCVPPYVIDATGIHIPKPQCL
jgi:serine/threonine-protein kinase